MALTAGRWAAVAGCKHHGSFWAEDALAYLLLSDSVSHTGMPTLVPTLIERRRIALLELAVRHVRDLPETLTVELVRFALAPVGPFATSSRLGRVRI